jgi:hypothetical protein
VKLLHRAGRLNEPLDEVWSRISADLSDVLLGNVPMNEDISPFDALIEVDDDEQLQLVISKLYLLKISEMKSQNCFRLFAILKTQIALRNGSVCDAVGIYRAARGTWPETGGVFGTDEMAPDDEMVALHEVFHKDMRAVFEVYERVHKNAYGRTSKFIDDVEQEEDQRQREEEEEELGPSVSGDDEINEKKKKIDDDENGLPEKEEKLDELDEEDDKNEDQDEEESKYVIEDIPFDFEEFVSECFGKPEVLKW